MPKQSLFGVILTLRQKSPKFMPVLPKTLQSYCFPTWDLIRFHCILHYLVVTLLFYNKYIKPTHENFSVQSVLKEPCSYLSFDPIPKKIIFFMLYNCLLNCSYCVIPSVGMRWRPVWLDPVPHLTVTERRSFRKVHVPLLEILNLIWSLFLSLYLA